MIKKLYRKFSDWMGYNPPGALTSTGWRLFKKEFKEVAPARYWVKHTFRLKYYLPILWKWRKVSDYFRYRLINRYHVVNTGLPPGYNEIDTKILHTCFTMLVDFVEVEKAWSKFIWSEHTKLSWGRKHIPLYDKFVPFRRPDLGLEHLGWEATLDDPSLPPQEQSPQQAKDAREIRELYLWWTKVRPARKEAELPPYHNQGFEDILAPLDSEFDRDAEDYKNHQAVFEENQQLSEKWDQEDEEMLIRLIKVRKSMWT